MRQFGDKLREARVATGMTQEKLGFELGVTKASVSAWETGREVPSFRLLNTLRETLNCSLDNLICEHTLPESGTAITDTANAARNPDERALLARYRQLPSRKRNALLDLLEPE